MAKKAKKVKKEGEYTDILVYQEEGWHLTYRDLKGLKREERLDAETLADAKHETSHLLGVPETQIQT